MKSYYEILGVSDNADAVAIKKAYRSLVKKYHPDIYKGDDRDTKFQEIQKAYNVLSDEDKRTEYDARGHNNYEQSQKYGYGANSSYTNFSDFSDFSGFSGFTSSVNVNDLPLWKKLLIYIGIALFIVITIIGVIIISIFNLLKNIIRNIFR